MFDTCRPFYLMVHFPGVTYFLVNVMACLDRPHSSFKAIILESRLSFPADRCKRLRATRFHFIIKKYYYCFLEFSSMILRYQP